MKTKITIFLCLFSVLFTSAIAQSLDSLLNKAYNNNPGLKALQLEYEAALQKGPQVSQLPNPTIGIGVPILSPETRLGSQVLSVSASQMFPWFGTLKARENVVITMAKSRYEQRAAERLNIDYKIKTAYYKLYQLHEEQTILKRNIRIFLTLEKVALAKVESGKSLASDVLSVRLKIEELGKQVQLREEQKKALSAQINEAIGSQENIPISVDIAKVNLADLTYDLATHRENIQNNHPLIKQIDWNIETSANEIELNNLSNKLSFGVGLDYSLVESRTDANPVDNGRDILIPKVMLTLPIYRKKYNAKKEEELLKQLAFNQQKEQVTNVLISKIKQYKSEFENAILLFELAQLQIELSNSAYDILLEDYSNKGQRFDELLKLQNDINQYELNMLRAAVQTHLAKFRIEHLTDF